MSDEWESVWSEEHEAACETARELISVIDARLEKWRSWFPNEEAEVEVPRRQLLALAEIGRAYLAQRDRAKREREERGKPVNNESMAKLVGFKRYDWKTGTADWSMDAEDGVTLTVRVWDDATLGVDAILNNGGYPGDCQFRLRTQRQVLDLLRALGVPVEGAGA